MSSNIVSIGNDRIILKDVWPDIQPQWQRIGEWVLNQCPLGSVFMIEFREKGEMSGIGVVTVTYGSKRYVRDWVSCFDHLLWAQDRNWRKEEMIRIQEVLY